MIVRAQQICDGTRARLVALVMHSLPAGLIASVLNGLAVGELRAHELPAAIVLAC